MRLITLERQESAEIITLARPECRNAMSLELMLALVEALSVIEADDTVRSIIIAGEGKVFCSGHDLSQMTGRSESEYQHIFDVCTQLMLKLQRVPQPVIAEVQGLATAAGCQLVAACDLAVASEEASFATPGVRIGMFCTTPGVPLVRAVGRKRAMQMLLTGEAIDARTAEAWGLINNVVPAGELRTATIALARRIAEASVQTIATGKRAFYETLDLPETQAYERAKCVMAASAACADAQEGISAFLEKRRPAWSK
jgi:enoyl-CoA hydratase/carnithine racemase